MSDVSVTEVDAASLEGKKKTDQLLAGIVWGAAAFSLGLSVVVMLLMDDAINPIEAMIDWLAV